MTSTRKDLIFPELSYKIVGILYDVYNKLGNGYQEKYYQRAIESSLKQHNIQFLREVATPIKYDKMNIGRYFLDFLVEGEVVLEIKRGEHFSRSNIQQVIAYLKSTSKKLGILANFTSRGVMYKRILNDDSYIRKDS